jgi:hypothetical protein
VREISFGFHAPYFSKDGRPHPPGWLGHCEAWFYEGETWTFIDPQAKGLIVRSVFRHDDVLDELHARFALCVSILRVEVEPRPFRSPPFQLMTCASICGALVGIRALAPSGLHRKLRAIGAIEINHDTKAKPSRLGGAGEDAA